MNILVITNLYPPQVLGGYERSIADFARLLQHQGHEVLVLTSDTPQFSAEHTSLYPDPPVQRCLSLLGAWTSAGTQWFEAEQVITIVEQNQEILKQHVRTFRPHVCLAGNLDFLQLEAEVLDFLLSSNVPVAHYVMNAHPGYACKCFPKQPTYRFVTCSDWVTKSLEAAGYPIATAQTIYPGADVDAFYQANLPLHDHLRIAYASLVASYKGADVLVEALSILHAAGIEFTATIAGGTFQPEFVKALKHFIVEEELDEKVRFTGALSRQELSQLYQTHNVLVFPSRFQEPFGISQIEAMAAGLTLVTSGTGGAGEILDHEEDGLEFESENPLDLADALSTLSAQPEAWEKMARKGQQKAMTQFSQAKALEQLETLLLNLAAVKV